MNGTVTNPFNEIGRGHVTGPALFLTFINYLEHTDLDILEGNEIVHYYGCSQAMKSIYDIFSISDTLRKIDDYSGIAIALPPMYFNYSSLTCNFGNIMRMVDYKVAAYEYIFGRSMSYRQFHEMLDKNKYLVKSITIKSVNVTTGFNQNLEVSYLNVLNVDGARFNKKQYSILEFLEPLEPTQGEQIKTKYKAFIPCNFVIDDKNGFSFNQQFDEQILNKIEDSSYELTLELYPYDAK